MNRLQVAYRKVLKGCERALRIGEEGEGQGRTGFSSEGSEEGAMFGCG